jgi:hypothetical protein
MDGSSDYLFSCLTFTSEQDRRGRTGHTSDQLVDALDGGTFTEDSCLFFGVFGHGGVGTLAPDEKRVTMVGNFSKTSWGKSGRACSHRGARQVS